MSERLYWAKPEDKGFTATVVKVVSPAEADPRVGLVLDRTLFYPEGGGQPCDTGRILVGDSGVELSVEKVSEENGAIVHWLAPGDDPVAAHAGYPVRGEIDWARRFDHMQQHTGQHVLSQAFIQVLQVHTTGFHLSTDYASIDLNAAGISAADIKKVEDAANEVVFQDMPVTAKEYLSDELPPEVRRRIPKVTEKIRVVHIGEFDACACGGTHVSSTGEIGLIKVNEATRSKAHGGTRIIFRCGWQALRDYGLKENTLLTAAKLLARPYEEVPAGITALGEKAEQYEKEAKDLRWSLLDLEAQLLAKERLEGGTIVKAMPGKTMDELRQLAKTVAALTGQAVVLFAREPRFSAALVRGAEGDFDCRTAAAQIAKAFGARGGGTPETAQVGSKEGLPGEDDEIAAQIRGLLK